MRWVPGIILVMASLGATAAAAMDPEEIRPFPAVSSGDIRFDFDAARFCAEDGGTLVEYYFRIPNRGLSLQPAPGDSGGPGQVQLEFELEFHDGSGRSLEIRKERVDVRAGLQGGAEDDRFQLVNLSYPLNPLAASVRAIVREPGTGKRGLLYFVTGRRRDGEAWARFSTETRQGPGLCVSDPQFAWQIEAERDSVLRARGGIQITPNPSRAYGLKNPTLWFYYEVRAAGGDSITYDVRYNIEGSGRAVVEGDPFPVTAAGGWSMSEKLDLSTYEAGTYVLKVRVARRGETLGAEASGEFNVLWSPLSWGRPDEDVLDEASLYLSEAAYGELEEMSPGDRARFLEGFWRQYDPTPGTARNELLEEFFERVDYAKGHFSSFGGGHLSDRGRIYIRFGEPDDLKRELIPEEADRLGSFLSDDAADDSELKSALAFDRSRPRAYEIWSYFGRGHALFPDQDLIPGGRAIRFIFVDDQGYGDFRLKHSTEHGAVR